MLHICAVSQVSGIREKEGLRQVIDPPVFAGDSMHRRYLHVSDFLKIKIYVKWEQLKSPSWWDLTVSRVQQIVNGKESL